MATPRKPKHLHKPVGRPTVMTEELINKLETVFALGGTDKEACFYAGISHQTLYDYQALHPEFVERKEALKQQPILKARQTVVTALNQPQHAQWFLARKAKDEFSERVETKNETTVIEETSPEVKKLAELLNDLHRKTN